MKLSNYLLGIRMRDKKIVKMIHHKAVYLGEMHVHKMVFDSLVVINTHFLKTILDCLLFVFSQEY